MSLRTTLAAGGVIAAGIGLAGARAQVSDTSRAVVRCGTCHEEQAAWTRRSNLHAPVRQEECLSCHNAHASRHGSLLRHTPMTTCLGCHEDLAKKMRAETPHSVMKGARQCLACHDPHASDRSDLLVAEIGELCGNCHEETPRDRLGHPHAPFANGDCLACHDPHSASSAYLSVRGEPDLCSSCHDLSGGALAGAHKGISIAGSRCTSCHAPHGSESPGMLRRNVHAPFSEGCDTCHASPPADPASLRERGAALCTTCHEPHDGGHPIPVGTACLSCHDPHAASDPAFIAGRERDVCLACHTDLAAQRAAAMTYHAISNDSPDCTTCHELHTRRGAGLLKKHDSQHTCSECHAGHAQFSHPMGVGVVDPSHPDRFVGCLSCHDPHGTAFPQFLLADPRRELCVRCHEDGKQGVGVGG